MLIFEHTPSDGRFYMGTYIMPSIMSFVVAFTGWTATSAISSAGISFIPVVQAQESIPQPKTYEVFITAYSSTPDETDSTPNITASNKPAREGIIAANFLPFGTKVKIPSVFGDKIFIVEDRMHKRKKNFVDIWMPSKEDALKFGIIQTEILAFE